MKEAFAYRTAFLALLAFFFLAESAQALVPGDEKILRGRMGLGFTKQVAITPTRTLPSLSAKYYASQSTALGFGVGFDTEENNSTLALSGKFYKNIFFESNLIFYMGLGGAYLSRQGSRFQGSAFLGSEFFFEKIPSLGFSFEAGVRGDNTGGKFALRTTGDTFLTAGMHFYL